MYYRLLQRIQPRIVQQEFGPKTNILRQGNLHGAARFFRIRRKGDVVNFPLRNVCKNPAIYSSVFGSGGCVLLNLDQFSFSENREVAGGIAPEYDVLQQAHPFRDAAFRLIGDLSHRIAWKETLATIVHVLIIQGTQVIEFGKPMRVYGIIGRAPAE